MIVNSLSIFISSPGDVMAERAAAERVIHRLRAEFAAHLALEAILWEHEPMFVTASFQEQIPSPAETDIVVCILWSRLGTRLPGQFRKPDGSRYGSGTEYEFEIAAESYKSRRKPDLLLYRKTAAIQGTFDDLAAAEEKLKQKRALDEFLQKWLHDEAEGTLIAAFHPFDRLEEFEEKIEAHLRRLIESRLPALRERSLAHGAYWKMGSPFRGLSAFEIEHAPIFHGRTRAVEELLSAMKGQAAQGKAFVLVLGSSGVGKTSLVRAGVLPLLMRPGVAEGIGFWRHAILRPGDSHGDLFDGLAHALVAEKAFPNLQHFGGVAELARLLRNSPGDVATWIKGGISLAAEELERVESLEREPQGRLVFVLDQMEELFTLDRIGAEERKGFIQALAALARSGWVWVLATLRSDFYARCAEFGELAELKMGSGTYHLLPPSEAELRKMIREPARAAGVSFEEDDPEHGNLDDRLLQAAIHDPGALLPLLEFTLDELYQTKDAHNVLTHKAYDALGGVEGALAKRAEEEVFSGLRPEVQAALPSVLSALVVVAPDDDLPAGRRAESETVCTTPQARDLVNAFVNARLLVTDRDQSGRSIVGLAHESLIRKWPRLVKWREENMEFLRARARLKILASIWVSHGRDRDYLLSQGKPMAEGEELLHKSRTLLTNETVEFIEASLLQDVRLKEAEQKRLRITEEALAVAEREQYYTSIQFVQSCIKERRFRIAEQTLLKASERLRNIEWGLLMLLSHRELIELSDHKARLTMARFSPDGSRILVATTDGGPIIWDARVGKVIGTLAGNTGNLRFAQFSPDSSRILTVSNDTTVRIWDSRTGQELFVLNAPPQGVTRAAPDFPADLMFLLNVSFAGVCSAQFSPNGSRIVTASTSSEINAEIWDVRTGRKLMTLPGITEEVNDDGKSTRASTCGGVPFIQEGVADDVRITRGEGIDALFSPDGSQIVTVSSNGLAAIWNAHTGRAICILDGISESIKSPEFSTDGLRILAISIDKACAIIWDTRTGHKLHTLIGRYYGLKTARFSPDGLFVITTHEHERTKIWDLSTGLEVKALGNDSENARSAAFSRDGTRILMALSDGSAKIWDASTSMEILSMAQHEAGVSVSDIQFSPDGSRVVTVASDGAAKIWGGQITEPIEIECLSPVASGRYNPDGTRIVSISSGESARIWDATTGQEICTLSGHTGGITCARYSPDGARIVTASWDNSAKIWNALTGQEVSTLSGHSDHVNSAQFSPDGSRIVTASGDGTAKTWDATTSHLLLTLVGHSQRVDDLGEFSLGVTDAHFSPDGTRIVTASGDTTAKIWDANTGKEIYTLAGHTKPVWHAQFSPDGALIVTASDDSTAKIWDATTGKELHTLVGYHSRYAWDAQFSPDGERIIAASTDETVKIWNVRTGEELQTLSGLSSAARSVQFSPDGSRVVTASHDRTFTIWDANTGREFLEIGEPIGGVHSAWFSSDGAKIAVVNSVGTVKLWNPVPYRTPDLPGDASMDWNTRFHLWQQQEYRKWMERNEAAKAVAAPINPLEFSIEESTTP